MRVRSLPCILAFHAGWSDPRWNPCWEFLGRVEASIDLLAWNSSIRAFWWSGEGEGSQSLDGHSVPVHLEMLMTSKVLGLFTSKVWMIGHQGSKIQDSQSSNKLRFYVGFRVLNSLLKLFKTFLWLNIQTFTTVTLLKSTVQWHIVQSHCGWSPHCRLSPHTVMGPSLSSVSWTLHLLKLKPRIHETLTPPAPGTHHSFVSVNLAINICNRQNHTGFVLLWLAYFTEHNILKVHPCWSMESKLPPL